MSELKQLIERCKCGVHVAVNEHRDFYESVSEYMQWLRDHDVDADVEDEVFAKMIQTDQIVEVQIYPESPVGFYEVYHYDLDEAIKEAIRMLDEPKEEPK